MKAHRVIPKEKKQIICRFWVAGNCIKSDDQCTNLHSWFRGNGISIIANLQGHTKGVTGIAYPSRGDKLYSGSRDGTLRIWDCHSGQCVKVVDFDTEVSSLIVEGSWIFVGLPNVVKALNIENGGEFNLNGVLGQVYTMAFNDNMLYSGTKTGQILAWKLLNNNVNPFKPPLTLEGHSKGVVCFSIGLNRLFSGSMDGTIKVFDLDTKQCVLSLKGHSETVMSLICWANYLLSCSLDGTIKAWEQTQQGSIQVCYTHQEKQGVLGMTGMSITGGPPEGGRCDVLLVSCIGNSVRLYELPSFKDKGSVFTKQNVEAIQAQQGLGGLFFVGDGTGLITVAKLAY